MGSSGEKGRVGIRRRMQGKLEAEITWPVRKNGKGRRGEGARGEAAAANTWSIRSVSDTLPGTLRPTHRLLPRLSRLPWEGAQAGLRPSVRQDPLRFSLSFFPLPREAQTLRLTFQMLQNRVPT